MAMARISAFKRGHSYWRLVLRYSQSSNSCANGLAKRILRRYLRVTKFTCLDRRESMDRLNELIWRLKQRHPVTHHLEDMLYALRCDGNEIWIDGKMVVIDPKKMPLLKRMDKLVKKIDLDQRSARDQFKAIMK